MENSKKVYTIIKELWVFFHKYCDVLDNNSPINWEEYMEELRDNVDGKFINDNDIDVLRRKLFLDATIYIKEIDKEVRKANGK